MVHGLHPTVFERVQADWRTLKEDVYPTTFPEFVSEMQQIFDKYMKDKARPVRPEDDVTIFKVNLKSSKAKPAAPQHSNEADDSDNEGASESEEASVVSSVKPDVLKKTKCIFCGRIHGTYCWDFDAIKRYTEAAEKSKAEYEKRKEEKMHVSHFSVRYADDA